MGTDRAQILGLCSEGQKGPEQQMGPSTQHGARERHPICDAEATRQALEAPGAESTGAASLGERRRLAVPREVNPVRQPPAQHPRPRVCPQQPRAGDTPEVWVGRDPWPGGLRRVGWAGRAPGAG